MLVLVLTSSVSAPSIVFSWVFSLSQDHSLPIHQQKDVGHMIGTQAEALLACELRVVSPLGTIQHLPRIIVKGEGHVQ